VSFADVRTEMANVVHTAAPHLHVYSYEHPEPQLPAAIVTWSAPISFQGGTANGALRFAIVVRLIVGKSDPLLSTQGLDRLITSTLPDAIRDHVTEHWQTANPTSISPPEALGEQAVMVEMTIDMHAQIT